MTAERAMDPVTRIIDRDNVNFEDDPPIHLPVRRHRRVLDALTWPVRAPWGCWSGLTSPERVMYRGLVLLAGGFAMVWVPLGLIVPGVVLTAAAFGFTFARREVSDG